MDKKCYSPPRIIPYLPDQVPETVIQLFRDDLPPATKMLLLRTKIRWIARRPLTCMSLKKVGRVGR